MQRLFSICLLLFLFSPALLAQIQDDFSDGDFSNNPVWVGNNANFIVNTAGELQLMAPAAGVSRLAVQGDIADSCVWDLQFRLEFAPSTSNLLRIYLLADQADLSMANGYLLEIGETGSLDAIRFMRQDAGSRTLLFSGVQGAVANEPVVGRVVMKRSSAGVWTLTLASGGSPALVPQGSISDLTYPGGASLFFGLDCTYTATRTDKFFFDNISVLPDLPDTQPPTLLGAQVDNAQQLTLFFNEALDPVSAQLSSNYTIPGGRTVSAANLLAGENSVQLDFGPPLVTGQYTVQCTQIADTSGNISGTLDAAFNFTVQENALYSDVIINEIMADPSPTAGLPEQEWLELYNRSNKIINLKTLTISDGGTAAVLPDYSLQPDSFVVLCTTAAAASLSTTAPNVLGVSGFPSLNNDGETLTLARTDGLQIDQVAFSINWHTDSGKRDGGWSLERINPTLPCLGASNWQSCPLPPGGTPGKANASLSLAPDQVAPKLVSVYPESANSIRLVFSEGLDQASASVASSYSISPDFPIAGISQFAGVLTEVVIQFVNPMAPGQVYALQIMAPLQDCSGNVAVATDTFYFGMPQAPQAGDVVINEILPNPATGGSRFVELYNQSARIFDLQSFFIANFNGGADVEPLLAERLFLPGEYLVITENPADILQRFANTRSGWVVENNLPSLSDKADNITLYWSSGANSLTIDSVDYTDAWHNPFYSSADKEGVSLERIRASGPSNDAGNWTSAAGIAGGPSGTPTRPNSQALDTLAVADQLIAFSSQRLSPDGDGYEDFLEIQYQLPQSGYEANVTIFDSGGTPVKHLVRQELLGTEGALRWEGDADDGSKVRPGIYVVLAELFEPGGSVHRFKQAVAVVQFF